MHPIFCAPFFKPTKDQTMTDDNESEQIGLHFYSDDLGERLTHLAPWADRVPIPHRLQVSGLIDKLALMIGQAVGDTE